MAWLGTKASPAPTQDGGRAVRHDTPRRWAVAGALLGAAAGWFGWRRTGRTQRSLGLALVLLGAVLGFGLSDTGWRRFTPMRLLFELPGFDAIRGAGRYWTLALLGLAVLCAGAVMWLDDVA